MSLTIGVSLMRSATSIGTLIMLIIWLQRHRSLKQEVFGDSRFRWMEDRHLDFDSGVIHGS